MLHLVNSPEVEDKIANANGRIAKFIQAKATPEQAVEELYLAALARYPTPEDKKKALDYLAKKQDIRRGLEDLMWALLNSREFMFNH